MRADIVFFKLLNDLGCFDGVYPLVIPDAVSMANGVFATYTTVTRNGLHTKTSRNEFDTCRMQVSIFSGDYDAANVAAAAVRAALDGYSNNNLVVGVVSYNVHSINFEEAEDLGFLEADRVFMVAVDYTIYLKQ